MQEHIEMLEFFLPENILEYFEIVNVRKTEGRLTIRLQEKDWVPEVSKKYRGKKVTSKGFKDFLVEDFPARGRRVTLELRRRVWKIEDVKELLKRDIPVTFPNTKLDKEFALFLKDADRARACGYFKNR